MQKGDEKLLINKNIFIKLIIKTNLLKIKFFNRFVF